MKECAADKNWDQFYLWVQRIVNNKSFSPNSLFLQKSQDETNYFDIEYLTRKSKFRHFCQLYSIS